ncbi:MAG: tetratricopeptide repeat protein [Phycisphaerales bacterium]|nr:tetratricopeptide repeat protein [Phycisphaerales bacterium]
MAETNLVYRSLDGFECKEEGMTTALTMGGLDVGVNRTSSPDRALALFSYGLFTVIAGVFVVTALRYPLIYIWATYEDLLGEWIQFWLYVATMLLSLRVVFTSRRHRPFFGLLAVACFYVAMEEISWGQRVLGFASPEFFRQHNLQGETNVHNFLTGPFGTSLKAAMEYAVAAALVVYGLFYPLSYRTRFRIAVWAEARGLAVPPGYLWPFFTVAACLELGPLQFNEGEIAEILVGTALAVMAMQYAFAGRRALSSETSRWPQGAAGKLAGRGLFGACLLLSLAANTTLAIHVTPDGRERNETRIANGVDKFAARYARYRAWDMAIALLERARQANPGDASVLRKLARCHRDAGDAAEGDRLLHLALAMDLKQLDRDPEAASVNRSLVRTYELLGDQHQAQFHIDIALRIGLLRIQEHPTSAKAAYSLGRTYELMGRDAEALEQFERAVELDPASRRFQSAYRAAGGRADSAGESDLD